MTPEEHAAELADLRAQVAALQATVENQRILHANATLLSIVQAGQIIVLTKLLRKQGAQFGPADLEAETRWVLLRIGDSMPVPAEALEAALVKMGFFTTDNPAP